MAVLPSMALRRATAAPAALARAQLWAVPRAAACPNCARRLSSDSTSPDWVDPRGTYAQQRAVYEAELSAMRKDYAAEVAAKREQIVAEHAEKTELHRRTQTNADPETVACAPRTAALPFFLRGTHLWMVGGTTAQEAAGPAKTRANRVAAPAQGSPGAQGVPPLFRCLRAPASFAPLRAQRAAGAERHLSKEAERQARNDRLIDALVLEEPNWVQPDRVEEAIIHALDNPIRIDV